MELNDLHLAKGILYGLYEPNPDNPRARRAEGKETYVYLMKVLYKAFNSPSLEKFILDISANARDVNGTKASYIMLKVGRKLCPDSSLIISDLVMDLWDVAVQANERNGTLKEIPPLVDAVDLNGVHPQAKEVLCYFGLCATVLTNDMARLDRVLENYIYPHVTNRVLKDRVKMLLENSETITFKDLTLTRG